MKDVLCIYAQRSDNDEVWEEPNAIKSHYTGNTIAVIEGPGGTLKYDFSGCGDDITGACLDAFFTKIGVQMGVGNAAIWRQLYGQTPSLN